MSSLARSLRGNLARSLRPSGAFIPSLAFPSNVIANGFDMDFVNDRYALNGVVGNFLPDGSNTDDGRLLRGQVSPIQPTYLEQADGSLKTYTSTLATIRRSNLWGIFIGMQFTNTDLQSRSLNNASWTAAGCTVAKTGTGRTGVANSCSVVTLTSTTATLTLAASTDSTARSRIACIEAKQTTGSGGTLALSMDNAATFPALNVVTIAGAGALGFKKYRSTAVQTALASPQKQIKLTGNIGDVWVLDFSETLWTSNPDTELLAHEQPGVATTTTAVTVQRDRPTAGIAGYTGTTVTNPPATFFQQAVQAHYFEWWQRRDGGLIASAAGVQISTDQTLGLSSFGSNTVNKPVYTTDMRAPVKNKGMIGRKGTEGFLILNGGAMVNISGATMANTSDHDDWGTNGADILSIRGGIFRHVATTDYDNFKALALAGATL
jgi:hypothetical protein